MEQDQFEQQKVKDTPIQRYNSEPHNSESSAVTSQQLSLLEALPYPAWIKNRRAEYLFVNQAYSNLIGTPASKCKGKTDRQLFSKHLHSLLVDSDAKVFSQARTVEIDDLMFEAQSPDTYWLSKSPLMDKSGKVSGIIGLLKKNKRVQSDSISLADLAGVAFRNSNEAIIVADIDFNIILSNPTFSRITGFSEQDIIGKPASAINANWLAPEFMESIKHCLHYQGFWDGETWNRRKDGQLYSEKIRISVVKSAKGDVSHYIGQFTDNTEQKQSQEKLEFLAFHDPLTGLANRALFQDHVTQSIQNAERNKTLCAIIYLDLNEFKPLNDTFGHAFGDKVLVQASGRLRDIVRKADTVSRQGGDEFAILLNETASIEAAVLVAQKIISSLRQPMQIDDQTVSIGASAGISVYPEHGDGADKLIGNADKAMYAAKFLGGNGYYLYK